MTDRRLDRWQECDHHDERQARVIVLCNKCGTAVIGPHPRLYHRLATNAPWPGCMELCVDCKHRAGVACTHPRAKVNGGEGVLITIKPPVRAFVDGTHGGRKIGWLEQTWTAPPTGCRQKEAIA
jgi:hypothetical protein